MSKPKNYEVVNPHTPKPESKKERQKHERQEKKFRDAVFAYTPEQQLMHLENMRRHAAFDDSRRAGGRGGTRRRAIDDARE